MRLQDPTRTIDPAGLDDMEAYPLGGGRVGPDTGRCFQVSDDHIVRQARRNAVGFALFLKSYTNDW